MDMILLCTELLWLHQFLLGLCDPFSHILWNCFTGTGTNTWLPKFQCSKSEEWVKIIVLPEGLFNTKMPSYQEINLAVEIKWSYDPHLISTMGFPTLVKWHLYLESGPRISVTILPMQDKHILAFHEEVFQLFAPSLHGKLQIFGFAFLWNNSSPT